MSEAYHQGVRARRRGESHHKNPFNKGTPDHANWATGWRAEEELILGMSPDSAFKRWEAETG